MELLAVHQQLTSGVDEHRRWVASSPSSCIELDSLASAAFRRQDFLQAGPVLGKAEDKTGTDAEGVLDVRGAVRELGAQPVRLEGAD